jgi:hypothetical protein
MQKLFCKRRDLAERRADSRWQCGLALQRPDTLVRSWSDSWSGFLDPITGLYYKSIWLTNCQHRDSGRPAIVEPQQNALLQWRLMFDGNFCCQTTN